MPAPTPTAQTQTIIAATGHRPPAFAQRHHLTPRIHERLLSLATDYLAQHDPDLVISGMALGWDQIVAEAADVCGIRLHAAVPFPGQHLRWPDDAQRTYQRLLSRAYEVTTVSVEPYRPELMQIRNEWMVNHATRIMAMFNGQPGGTANCIAYARRQRKPIDNLWQRYVTEK